MSKRCAKCEKTVYPIEELKCLDKTWHKGCFKCESCGMTLNMKNYKGYDKLPYCNAHYPTTKFTAVADTPEFARIAQNSKIQSNLKYHEEFEKSKGRYTAVTDDPELLRVKANSAKFSSIKYHEDFEKNIKGTKTNVVDDPETLRLQQQSKLVSQVEYHGHKKRHDEMERQRASVGDDVHPTQISRRPDSDYNAGGDQAVPSPYTAKFTGHSTTYGAGGKVEHSQPRRNIGSISDYDPMQDQWGSINQGHHPAPGTGRTQQWEETTQVPRQQNNQDHRGAPPSPRQQQNVPMVPVNQPLSLMVHHPEQQEPSQQPAYYPPPQQQQQQQSPRHSYQQQQSPRNSAGYQQQQQSPRNSAGYQQQQQQSPRQSYQQQSPRSSYQQQQQQSPRQAAPQPRKTQLRKKGPLYQAMYDYEAQDDDEISFRDGDVIIDTEPIDEGWMYGTVERTGKRGMLPANYVERVQ